MTTRSEVCAPVLAWLGRANAVLAVLSLLLLVPGLAAGEEPSTRPFRLAPSADLALAGGEDGPSLPPCSGFESFLTDEWRAGCERVATTSDTATTEPAQEPEPPPIPRPWQYQALAYLIPVGFVAGALENSITEGPIHPHHFTSEGWFGAHTYAGGADKASHFVDYSILSRELTYGYEKLGYPRTKSLWIGFGLATLAGLANEFGDGFNKYGSRSRT